ncbi:MAG TPA: hypothetical protein VFS59_01100, partial [Gemmatimonadaceae bacterium]|nr:hypothetical protein [Gemmatimonadaceae bacterium]
SRAARVPPRDSIAHAPSESASARSATLEQGDTSARRATPKPRALTDAEQRVADGIVFAPSVTERFIVAARNKRLLVDVGRVDLEIKQDADLLELVRRVTARTGPLSRVAHVRVRGTWGEETDSIVGYDVWNGRAVAVLQASARADSLLKRNLPLVGVATRALASADTAVTPSPVNASGGCMRDSMPPALAARVALVRDSLVRWVADSVKSSYARGGKLTVRGDTASGCFGAWRAVVVVSARTPAFDWSEERTLLVTPEGKTAVSRLRDLRLRTHELLVAFDADGDGIDELAARGLAQRMGAQSVLKLDPTTRRFSRFASGFAWESR